MKTTKESTGQHIVNKNIIVSFLLAAVIGVFSSAYAQVVYTFGSEYLNQELTKERLNCILATIHEDEMEIEDWMVDPAYWENVSKIIERKYYNLVFKEDTEPELDLEPWMLNFHNEVLYANDYFAEEEQKVEDWMMDLNQFQPVIRIIAEK